MVALPFYVPQGFHGLAETEGILRLDQNELVLEFQTKDAVLGLIKSEVKEKRIPLDQLESVRYRKGFFHPSLTLIARSLIALDGLPGQERGEIKLHFARKYREELSQLTSNIEFRLSDHMLRRLKEDTDRL